MASVQTMTIRGEDEFTARAGQLFTDVTSEFLCAAADLHTWSHPDARPTVPAVARRTYRSLTGDLTVRKLYSPAATADERQRRRLLQLAGCGALVRISGGALPQETIVLDRRIMILAGPTVSGDREFTVTTSPSLVEGVRGLFDAAWEAATPLDAHLGREVPVIDAEGREILRALGDGLIDEVGARRVGVSLRTYRRRVAELMRLLESESRFQAGVHAGELGLLP